MLMVCTRKGSCESFWQVKDMWWKFLRLIFMQC